MYSKWGGSSVHVDESVSDADERMSNSNSDIGMVSVKSLEERWLLGAQELKKKKTGIDLGCVTVSRRVGCVLLGLIVISSFLSGLTLLLVKTLPRHHRSVRIVDNYTQALHQALRFYDAQKSGMLPKKNNISWRGDSGLSDGEDVADIGAPKCDLVGGFYDAGDNIKFTFPTAYTVTILSWSAIEYKEKFKAAKEYNRVREIIKWGTDYLLKTFKYMANSTNVEYIFAQVGQGTSSNPNSPNDHYCWERPEKMDYRRLAFSVTSGSDLGAEMAAALAAASIVFKDESAYSTKLVAAAQSLLRFAQDSSKAARYSDAVKDSQSFYNSTSFWDEYLWAGSWLYFATGDLEYLAGVTDQEAADRAGAKGEESFYGVFSWDNKLLGAQMLLTRLRLMQGVPYPYEELLQQYNKEIDVVMCSYLPQYKIFNRTEGGLTLFNDGKPAPLQYAANAAFLSALYADYLTTADVPRWPCGPNIFLSEVLREFSRSQIDYILGKNPMGMSYVVGFGQKYPKQVHHRAASIPLDKNNYGCKGGYKFRDSKSNNRYDIMGAMVGGPDKTDRFVDRRNNGTYTEPTIAGNAGLVGFLIALSEITKNGVDRNTLFESLPDMYVDPPSPPPPWQP